MSLRIPLYATFFALLVWSAVGLSADRADAAAPADGVYDIRIIAVGGSNVWDDSDFDAFGANEYDFAFMAAPEVTPVNLIGIDVVIIPWEHDYAWLTPSIAAALMQFVDSGGTLIIHSVEECEEICESALPEGFEDELLAFFPPEYGIEWYGDDFEDESVLILDPAHALVRQPNVLTSAGLSGWGDSIHSIVTAYGSAWRWALETDFADVEEGAGPVSVTASQDGALSTQDIVPLVDRAMVQGCAPFGDGIIVVSGQDPEYHDSLDNEAEAFLQIENEVEIGASGCGRDRRPQERVVPNIGAGLSGLFNGMPTPLPTAPSAVAPAASPAVTISPPRTGDGGLADGSSSAVYAAAIAVVGFLVLSGLILLRRRA